MAGLLLLTSACNYDNNGGPEFSIRNDSDEPFAVVLQRLAADGPNSTYDLPAHSGISTTLRGCAGTGLVVLDAQHRLVIEVPGQVCDGQGLWFQADGSVVLASPPTPTRTLVPSIPPQAARSPVPVPPSASGHS